MFKANIAKSISKKKNVLFVSPAAYPMGGVATWLDYLLPEIEQLGWCPTLGLVVGKHHDPTEYLVQHPFHRVVTIPNLTGSHEGRIRALCEAILNLDPGLVVSVNIADVYPAMLRLRRKRSCTIKTVMALHGIQSDLFMDAETFGCVIDAVISTNRLACQLVGQLNGFDAERVYYAPCGVDVDVRVEDSIRIEDNHKMRIAWVGRLEETQKRVSDIPTILQHLDEREIAYELWVVGDGPEHASLRRKLDPWLAKAKVKLFGALSRDEVYDLIYCKADILLLTSSWETGPIVVWEAMSQGVSVVTSNYLGLEPEGSLVNGENCLIFPVGDAGAAADSICKLRETTLRTKLRVNAHELVADRYSIQASVNAWSEAFSLIAAAKTVREHFPRYSVTPSGRLDGLLGTRVSEFVRRFCRLSHEHSEAGGEWPHTLSRSRESLVSDLLCNICQIQKE